MAKREKNPFRKTRMADRILSEVNDLIRTSLADKRVKFVTITKVELTPDLSHANLYWDTFETKTKGSAKTALDGIRGKIRSELSGILAIRYVPEIHFIYDNQFESEMRMTELLKEAKQFKSLN
jgi:ribosome-binding factor A